jgi:hypothetical protein
MFNLLEERSPVRQSEDGLMEAGTALFSGIPLQYSLLGGRLLTLEDIEGLLGFFRQLDPARPLLLISSCPGFSATSEEEAEGLVFQAGELRRCQQVFKQHGGRMVSVLHRMAVGGVYLMHGLSAQRRLALEDTVFHDTVPSRLPVPLHQALERGLLDEIVPAEHLRIRLKALLLAESGEETHH